MSPYREVEQPTASSSAQPASAWPVPWIVLLLALGQIAWVVLKRQPWGVEATLALVAALGSGSALFRAIRRRAEPG